MADEEKTDIGPLDRLVMLGYRVEQANEVEGTTVWFVEGFGMSTYVRGDDEEALASLVDEKGHAERELQQNETTEETALRWHDDPDNEFELPEDQLENLRAMVSALKEDQPESKED
jgi:hypothetical protein